MKITNEIIESSLYCKYKMYLKLANVKGVKTEYELFYKEEKRRIKEEYLKEIQIKNKLNKTLNIDEIFLVNQRFDLQNFSIDFVILEKIKSQNAYHKSLVIPVFISPTEKISKINALLFSCLGHFLKNTKFGLPEQAKIICGKNLKPVKLNIKGHYKEVEKIISAISLNEPPLILNNHCVVCEFQKQCKAKAIKNDSISLLDRVTPKILEKYKKKGIFTIEQLSYIYKPRKIRKSISSQILIHKNELQALALRTKKIYIQQLPELLKYAKAIFIDFESLPERNFYYLIGMSIYENEKVESYSFWADNELQESSIWLSFLKKISQCKNTAIYHYGSFENKAIEYLGKKYKTDITDLNKRLINLNNFIFGKIYFPVYSNRLKELGKFLNFIWQSDNADGMQSITWRLKWEKEHLENYKSKLINYNLDDCNCLISLLNILIKINESGNTLQEIEFVDKPKQLITEVSTEVYTQFTNILKFAHNGYDSKKITFQKPREDSSTKIKTGDNSIGHKGARRIIPKAKKIVSVCSRQYCTTHKNKLTKTDKISEHILTDIIFSKNSIRKTVIKYSGYKSYCNKCKKNFLPPEIEKIQGKHFGHNFKSWIIYQRVFLRLPIEIIQINLKELFNENISVGGVSTILMSFASNYIETDNQNLSEILKSPFIHIDETKINVRGNCHYAWIITDGKHVVFKETSTREIKTINDILINYKGILVADFYPGYESINTKHQKCWVHLIRDLNEDLRKNPFDGEYEKFISDLRNLIIPIFETIKKYGSKKRHFNKFKKGIKIFYEKKLALEIYQSEITIKYQARLKKNWDILFTFTEYDNIPWNNNMAERGLRHIAVQRKISTYFSNGINQYLIFLGIMQSCKFQNKSFLSFLISQKKTI